MEQKRIPAYKRVIPRPVLIVLACVLVIGTVVVSFLPGPQKARLGTRPYSTRTHRVTPRHRLYHWATFGSMAIVFLLLAKGVRQEALAAVFVFGLGFLIEIAQHLTGYSAVLEWWDVRDDLGAVAVVFTVVQFLNARLGNQQLT